MQGLLTCAVARLGRTEEPAASAQLSHDVLLEAALLHELGGLQVGGALDQADVVEVLAVAS